MLFWISKTKLSFYCLLLIFWCIFPILILFSQKLGVAPVDYNYLLLNYRCTQTHSFFCTSWRPSYFGRGVVIILSGGSWSMLMKRLISKNNQHCKLLLNIFISLRNNDKENKIFFRIKKLYRYYPTTSTKGIYLYLRSKNIITYIIKSGLSFNLCIIVICQN